MKKPTSCQGCPLFDDGEGFVPDELVPGATVDVWLQNPGETEERKAQPAVGSTGEDLNDKFLPAAGLTRGVDVNVRNVLRCRARLAGKKCNNLPSGKVLEQAIQHCRVHDAATGATVSIAAGGLAWRMHGGPGTITDWRGFPHPTKPVLATLHPADLYRNPKMKHPVMQDWAKVQPFQAGTWPSPVPPFQVVRTDQEVTTYVQQWAERAIERAPFVALDTEFTRDTRFLLTLGLGYPGMDGGLQIWFGALDSVSRSAVRSALLALVGRVPVVYQNAMADIPVIRQAMGITYKDYCRVDDTMLAHAVLWSEWPHTLEFLASMYGKYPKMKHLSTTNPELYNWGDVLDTISVWQGVSKELKLDPLSEAVYQRQSLPLLPILLDRARKGIRVDQAGVARAISDVELRRSGAQRLAQSACGYPLGLSSDKQLKEYLYDYKGYPVQYDKAKKVSVAADAISALRRYVGPPPESDSEQKDGLSLQAALQRISDGADPVLESRVVYAAAQQELSHFLAPLEGKERVYPNIKIHAQASGRWSITEPPLQQFPDYLQELLIPDEGEAWIGWDWDQIELRVLAALSGDDPYLSAFERGDDVHTLNAIAIFGPPSGNPATDDLRRSFAKRFVYRLNYGGDPRTAGDIPGASQLGLSGSGLVAASQRYLAAHPAMASWRIQVAAEAKRTRVSRTFMGRRRRLLGEGQSIVREAYNHPMQGAVADILNTVTIQISDAFRRASLVYTVHDAAWWAVPVEDIEDFRHAALPIITQGWDFNGRRISIPAKWKAVRVSV